MLKLLRKDWIFNWRVLAFAYVLWSAMWLGYPTIRPEGEASFDAWAVMVSLMCAFLPIMIVSREDKFKAGALACSLPVTRDTIVASKYVGGWVVALVGVAVAVAAMWPLQAAGWTEMTAPTLRLPLGVVVTVGLVLTLLLPFTLRFGVAGLIGFLVVMQLLGIALLLASAMFGGGGGIRPAFTAGVSAVGWVRATLGPVGFTVATVVAVVALNVSSCRLAVWVFRRREF